MAKKSKQPLMRRNHLPLILLGTAMTVYGLVTALVGSWFSNQAMRGLITAGVYRSQQAAFEQAAGLSRPRPCQPDSCRAGAGAQGPGVRWPEID